MPKLLPHISTGGAISASPLNIDLSFEIYEEDDEEEEYVDFRDDFCGGCTFAFDFLIGVFLVFGFLVLVLMYMKKMKMKNYLYIHMVNQNYLQNYLVCYYHHKDQLNVFSFCGIIKN